MSSPDLDAPVVETTLEEDLAAAMAEHNAGGDPAPTVDDAPADPAPDKAPAAGENLQDLDKSDAEAPVIPDKFALAPSYAKKAVKENWDKLPEDVRRDLHEREKEVHQQFTRFDEERNFGKQVKGIIAPYEGFIRGLGAEPVAAVDYLIKTDYALRTAPPEQRKAMFLKAAKDYGIEFAEGELGQPAPTNYDPRVETLQQQLNRLESERQSDINAKQLAAQQSIEQQIADFSSKPENVYFDRVSPMMASLLSSGQAQSLEQAYDMAVHADPETRALQIAAAQQVDQRNRQAEAKAKADKAKLASVSVTGAPGLAVPTSPQNSAGSLEDDIRNAIREANGRA